MEIVIIAWLTLLTCAVLFLFYGLFEIRRVMKLVRTDIMEKMGVSIDRIQEYIDEESERIQKRILAYMCGGVLLSYLFRKMTADKGNMPSQEN